MNIKEHYLMGMKVLYNGLFNDDEQERASNTITNEQILTVYNMYAYAKKIIFVYYATVDKVEYAFFLRASWEDLPPTFFKLDRTSGSQHRVVRFSPLAHQCIFLHQNDYYDFKVPVSKLDKIRKSFSTRVNRGHAIECYLHIRFGIEGTYKPENNRFDEAADITINGVDYEIKSDLGSFPNEHTLNKLLIDSGLRPFKPER